MSQPTVDIGLFSGYEEEMYYKCTHLYPAIIWDRLCVETIKPTSVTIENEVYIAIMP
jgi:hypothetical protein